MPKLDDRHIGVARIYSRALLELAEKQSVADVVLAELGEIAGLVERDERFAGFIASPLVDPDDRERFLEKVFRGRAADVLVDALQVMNRKGRLALLPTLAAVYHEDHEALRGRVEARVVSAVKLTEAASERLRRTLARSTGLTVDLVESVDPGLLGGLVVRVGDRKYDGSVLHKVRVLRAIFDERAKQHIYQSRADAEPPDAEAV
jgi:F-type H+-transporting ATPase subunit delta